jgi:NADH:ubiquinone oxidoreductase subunit 2 (subunit N)
MNLLINSYDFLIFFLSWELFNLSLYLLITSQGSYNEKSISIGIKYFLLSALSTAFLGIALIILYHEFGNLHYDNIY